MFTMAAMSYSYESSESSSYYEEVRFDAWKNSTAGPVNLKVRRK